MNEQTTKLIEQLAQKLGTTGDYLWSVLLKQAQISAITDLFYLVVICIGGYILLKTHKAFSKEGEDYNSKYCDNEYLIVIMCIVAIIWGVLFIAAFLSISEIMNGFLNPEYWALHQIISTLTK